MARKPFPWRKFTPTQIDLMERIAAAGGALPYDKLEYSDLLAFEELRRLRLLDTQAKGRAKLQAVLTDKGARFGTTAIEPNRLRETAC